MHTELELFSPCDGGMSVRTVSSNPSVSSPIHSNALLAQISASLGFRFGLSTSSILTKSDNVKSASVRRPMPMVEPIPQGIAFMTETAP